MEASKTAPHGKLLKRSQAARMLGVSVSTLRRREGDLVKPIVGPDGIHLFDEAEIRSVMVTVRNRTAVASLGASAGDTAADVFTLLDDGVHPVEIVKRLRLPPDTVTTLQEQWAHMRGAFVVSSNEASELGRLARTDAPTSAQQTLATLTDRIQTLARARHGTATCHACREKIASLCERCSIAERGPLGTADIRIERRCDKDADELRVVADVYWDSGSDESSDIAELSSDWFAFDRLDDSPIADLVRGVHRDRRAKSVGSASANATVRAWATK